MAENEKTMVLKNKLRVKNIESDFEKKKENK